MAKKPQNLAEVGDRVKMRGRGTTGKVTHINPDTKWTQVHWDKDGDQGPRFCHLYELERLNA